MSKAAAPTRRKRAGYHYAPPGVVMWSRINAQANWHIGQPVAHAMVPIETQADADRAFELLRAEPAGAA